MQRHTELLLIRHGESAANAGLSKDPNCPLTPKGLEQAQRVAHQLKQHDLADVCAVHSPYARAACTADQIARIAGARFAIDERIREWGEATQIDGRHYPAEAPGALVERLRDFLKDHRGQKVLVVSHAAPIAVLTQLAWGETPTTTGAFWSGVDNCCLRWLRMTCPTLLAGTGIEMRMAPIGVEPIHR